MISTLNFSPGTLVKELRDVKYLDKDILDMYSKGNQMLLGFRSFLYRIPIGSIINSITVGNKITYTKAAGTKAQLIRADLKSATVKLSTGKLVKVPGDSTASVGVVSNEKHRLLVYGKAGRNRNLGRRPIVRGVAMNPVDHPHGDIGNTRHVTLKVLYGSKFFRNVSANFRGVEPLKRKLLSSERHRLKSRILTVTKLLQVTPVKDVKSILKLSHRGIVHKFNVSTKRIRLQNKDSLLVPLNYLIRKDLYGIFYDSFQSFKFRLFSRNEDLYNDFVAVLALLSLRNISITILGVILARVVGSIHKRRHGLFISFLNILSKGVVSNLLSDISGVKITFSGRIFGRDIAKTICVDKGSPQLTTISTTTEHTHVDAFTVYGVYGLKFWISFKKKPRTRLSLTLKEKKSLLRRLKNFKLKQKRLARVTLRFQRRPYIFSSEGQRILLSKDKKSLPKASDPKKKSDFAVAVREVSRKFKLQSRKVRPRLQKTSSPMEVAVLKALNHARFPEKLLLTIRQTLAKKIKKQGKFSIKLLADVPVSKKPLEIRMGKGKGAVDHWIAKVVPGAHIIEIHELSIVKAVKLLREIQKKLPIQTKIKTF
eukprot:gene10953-12178_t